MTDGIAPFSLKDAPALIERLLPVQKLSAEAYKEQMAVHGKTLTALGSYWKGRKPLVLNKACVLGCLLPATGDPIRDLEIFELLMAMDDDSLAMRQKKRPTPRAILGLLDIPRVYDYFAVSPPGVLPDTAPIDWSIGAFAHTTVEWRSDIPDPQRRTFEVEALRMMPYRERVEDARRPEESTISIYDHIWASVNAHLGTMARSFPDLVEQLGFMRYGHRPRVADTFAGSGQIPFEAARLGCDVYAADLNPVACALTWGALNIVGGSPAQHQALANKQEALMSNVQREIDRLGVESDGAGWQAKVFLYCLEARCPETGWMVPLLSNFVVSKARKAIAQLVPDSAAKRYDIRIACNVSDDEYAKASSRGTLGRDARFSEPFMVHRVDGVEHKVKMSTLRGDYLKPDGTLANNIRLWEQSDTRFRAEDLFHERLYCVQWTRRSPASNTTEYEFRAVDSADLDRESVVDSFVDAHLAEWQAAGWVPNMRMEPGGPPRYEGLNLIRGRGWTYWHHLFNPRQLLVAGLITRYATDAGLKFGLTQVLNANGRLSRWNQNGGGGGIVAGVFDNQALNGLFNYGCRASHYALGLADARFKSFRFDSRVSTTIVCGPADHLTESNDIYITDPPYGDAVKYEEILDYFIAWLRMTPPPEFASWVWDSRRALAVSGEDEQFRRRMVDAYARMTEHMSENGIQVIMFTHQSGAIWADMANIVWASGLQVTAAWYVATEADRRIQEASSFVKGTVLLVCRRRQGMTKTTRDDLAWEIKEEVEAQVQALNGLNLIAKGLYRDESVFEDADIQMAGYAAALRVLTRYATIDGRDMVTEAIRPRLKGATSFVDGLIAFAVDTANQSLVPPGLAKIYWDRLSGAERFYLKMLDLETRGVKSLDNYQNFAKAFKVRDFRAMMGDQRANAARLKSAVEFGRNEMNEASELYGSMTRAVLYALMELGKGTDGTPVLTHMALNVPDYYTDSTHREIALEVAQYLASRLVGVRPDEAGAARVLVELLKNQRLG